MISAGLGEDEVYLTEEMTFSLALKTNGFSLWELGKVLKHDKVHLCFCSPSPLIWSLSSQGYRKITGLGTRKPEFAFPYLTALNFSL